VPTPLKQLNASLRAKILKANPRILTDAPTIFTYFRFYPDGYVIIATVVAKGDAHSIKKWFHKDNTTLSPVKYTTQGNYHFHTFQKKNGLLIDYTCIIKGNGMIVDIYNQRVNQHIKDTFSFIKLL